jgi:hypothetical protein
MQLAQTYGVSLDELTGMDEPPEPKRGEEPPPSV